MSIHTAARRLAVACALALPAAGLMVTAATPAYSDVPMQVRTATKGPSTAAVLSVSVMCSDGKVPVGGGLSTTAVNDNIDKAYLVESRPIPGTNGWRVTARKKPGVASWKLKGLVRCIDPPANFNIVPVWSATGSMNSAQASASCPPGTKLLGMGGHVANGGGEVFLTMLKPNASLTALSAGAAKRVGSNYTGAWSVTATALCGGSIAAVLESAESTTYIEEGVKQANVFCPTGKKVLSSGADVSSLAIDPRARTFLTDVDFSTLGHTRASETVPHSWTLQTFSICG